METVGLIMSCIVSFVLTSYLFHLNKKSQLQTVFMVNSILVFCWSAILFAQKFFCAFFDINPIIFDWFVYIPICFLPVSILFTSIIFANTKIKFKKKYILVFIIPLLSLIILWTNNLHHLFYINYSTNINENIYGNYFYVHSFYTLALYIIRFNIIA